MGSLGNICYPFYRGTPPKECLHDVPVELHPEPEAEAPTPPVPPTPTMPGSRRLSFQESVKSEEEKQEEDDDDFEDHPTHQEVEIGLRRCTQHQDREVPIPRPRHRHPEEDPDAIAPRAQFIEALVDAICAVLR